MPEERYFIKTDTLGTLVLKNIIVFDEYPRCFTCQDSFGTQYLLDEDFAEDNVYQWKCVKITNQKLSMLHNGSISLEDCFRSPEAPHCYLIRMTKEGKCASVNELTAFDPATIPEGSFFVSQLWDESISESFCLQNEANSSGSAQLDVYVFSDPVNHLIKFISFSNIINHLREFLTSISPKCLNNSTFIPVSNSLILRFNFDDYEKGNYIEGKETPSSKAVNGFFDIVTAGDSDTAVSATNAKKEILQKYARFFNSISLTKQPIKVVAALPSESKPRILVLSHDVIVKKKNMISTTLKQMPKTEPVIKKGTLEGIFPKSSGTFEFLDEDSITYKGKIDAALIKSDDQFVVRKQKYQVEMMKITHFASGKEISSPTYVLKKLTRI